MEVTTTEHAEYTHTVLVYLGCDVVYVSEG